MGTSAQARGRIALAAILGLGAGVRLWHLDRNDFGTDCYSAGGFGPGPEGHRRAQAFRDWLDGHGEEVPAAVWRSQRARGTALKLYAVRA